MTLLLTSFLVALSLADSAGVDPVVGRAQARSTTLDIPYLPQTEALCGGAAAAMVFRYWGDRHADVQQFAALVDRRAGGIADDVLVEAIRARQWHAVPLQASVDVVRDRLAAGQPLILLLQDRPGRYHYVVAVGADEDYIFLHDPTWGPSRRYTVSELTRVWQPSSFWALLVLPDSHRSQVAGHQREHGAESPALHHPAPSHVASGQPVARSFEGRDPRQTTCDQLLDKALDEIQRQGLSAAGEILAGVGRQCPTDAGPIGELAAVRFAERRWREAEALAQGAVARDPTQTYAWDVLGSSRFVQDDLDGALRAWNHLDKPRVDSVRIDGLSHTRYALVADALGLAPNTVLTSRAYRLADRRLQQLPNRLTARIGYRPQDDGFATVDVVVRERATRPRGAIEWLAGSAQAAVNREARVSIPGWTGQGEVWTASWRWWDERPRLAMAFAAPRIGLLPGVWRIEAAWDAQTYRASPEVTVREERMHGGIAVTDWLAPDLRYEIAAGVDSWDGGRRTMSLGGALERRLFNDRVAVSGAGYTWMPLSSGSSFRSASLRTTFRSSPDTRGLVQVVHAGIEGATENAPLAIWSGAGDGHARAPLLRAHPLLSEGVISGPVFGRRTAYLNVETERWLERPSLVRLGGAVFIDVAHVSRGFTEGPRESTQADIGVGLRLRIPGTEGTLRLDYGHGLRDRRDAITVGVARTF